MEVRATYDFSNWPEMDDAAFQAAGREPDFTGTNFCGRDLGWVCTSEIEGHRIARNLRKIGLSVEIRPTNNKE